MSIASQSAGPIERWCIASVGQMATQWPQSMQRSHAFGMGTGYCSFVISPPGQARMQLPQPMQRFSSALMIVSMRSTPILCNSSLADRRARVARQQSGS